MGETEKQMTKCVVKRRTNRRFYMEKLIQEHGAKCAYCGCEITARELISIDSYLPFRMHPECDEYENYILACRSCNIIKGDKEPVDEDGKILILHPYRDAYWKEIKVDDNGVAYGETEAGRSTVDIMRLNRSELVAYRNNNIALFIERVNDGERAYDVYKNSIMNIRKLISISVQTEELKEYYYRLIYANVIASMEAYLSKTIITLVLNNDDLFWNFVRKFEWNNEKIDISQIKQVYDEMDKKVQLALASVLYHNLPKVKNIYRDVLNICILEDRKVMGYLCKAVEIRHDIVHRNGRKNIKKSGQNNVDEYHNIQLENVEELISYVDELICNIEKQISSNIC